MEGSQAVGSNGDYNWTNTCVHKNERSILINEKEVEYSLIGCFVLVFGLPLVYVFVRRDYPEMKARSPVLTMISIALLMLDAILNTLIFSMDPESEESLFWVCFMSVWTTMMINVPVLSTMYLRVFRLKRVFQLYENYLKTMRLTLADQLVNREEQDVVRKSEYANRVSVQLKPGLSSRRTQNSLMNRQDGTSPSARRSNIHTGSNRPTLSSLSLNSPSNEAQASLEQPRSVSFEDIHSLADVRSSMRQSVGTNPEARLTVATMHVENISDTEYVSKMAALNERRLLCWAGKVCFIPAFLVALLATFFPYPQAVVPVHESQECICYFLGKSASRKFLLIHASPGNGDVLVLKIVNVLIFFGVNWLFLLLIIRNVYHVRHIRDRLEIRLEMTLIVVAWSFFCLCQYFWYLLEQIATDNCDQGRIESSNFMKKVTPINKKLTYCTIICRDLLVLIITVVFLIRVGLRENSLKRQLAKKEDL